MAARARVMLFILAFPLTCPAPGTECARGCCSLNSVTMSPSSALGARVRGSRQAGGDECAMLRSALVSGRENEEGEAH